MSEQQNSPINLPAGEILEAFRRVKQSGITVVYADAGERGIGTTQVYVASGGQALIRLDGQGTAKMMAAGPFAAGATLYPADDGKIDDVKVGLPLGKSLEAATAAGSIIEVVPVIDDASSVYIWVSPEGDDSSGNGSFSLPYATITKALTAVTTVRKTILVLPGEYTETLMLTWPSISGVSINGVLGHGDGATIAGTAGQTAVVKIDPTVQTSTFEATLSNVTIAAPIGVNGIDFNNTAVNRKINLYLKNVPIENADTNGSGAGKSLNVIHANAAEAMRVYASGQKDIWEGLLYIEPKNTNDRFQFGNLQFDGGVQFGTTTIASVSRFTSCIAVDDGGIGGQDTQILAILGCQSLTGTTYAAAALGDCADNAAEVVA